MEFLSRRDFGKNLSMCALGRVATSAVASPTIGGEDSSHGAKRKTTVLREMIKSPGIIHSPGIYDPLTAKIAESVGFRCVSLEGSALGIVKCQIEAALGLEDLAEATRSITSILDIPLLVDAGGGFGDPAHVYHTVRVLEHAGAAGIRIEDQISPKRFHYYMDGIVDVIPVEEMVWKIRYAAEARRDPDFVIGARTDVMKTHGFLECVRRANLYLQAGADYVLLFPRTIEEAKQVPKEIHGPLNFANTDPGLPGSPKLTVQELREMGWKMLNHPAEAILSYYKSIRDAFVQVKDTGSMGMDAALYGSIHKEIYEMLDLPAYYRIEYWTNRLGSAYRPGELPPIRIHESEQQQKR